MNQECQLNNEKDMYNDQNKYSQNFYGKYCHCKEEYHGQEEMHQCSFCEDWYHLNHLNPNSTKICEKLDSEEVEWRIMCKN